ncbi:hypothetical protein FRC10_006969 [Ceratobasidium sp. 414]|nr:hypothetical protein FRC10_006969 [Ceratobasidium sp. 414]
MTLALSRVPYYPSTTAARRHIDLGKDLLQKCRPFSEEEDEALRLGYEQHGTVWATIVKDPVFQSTRNPRPRATEKNRPGRRVRIVTKTTPKKRASGSRGRGRKVDDSEEEDDVDVDDDLESENEVAAATTLSSAGNARRGSHMRLRQHPSNPNGYIDVSALSAHSHSPQTESEDVDTSDSPIANIELPVTPSAANFLRELTPVLPKCIDASQVQSQDSTSEQPATATDEVSSIMSSHGCDSLIYPTGDADNTWLTGTSVTSPTTSEYFLHPHHAHENTRRDDRRDRTGKSAWATSDWLSGNPRLDNALSGALAFGGWGGNSVVDRYNLYTSSAGAAAHEFGSEVGQSAGDHRLEHNAFGDASIFRESNSISYYAGDIFPGSGVVNPALRPSPTLCTSPFRPTRPCAHTRATRLRRSRTCSPCRPHSRTSMVGVEALNTSPKRPSAHRSHSLFDFSCMDALDLQRPGYPVSFDGQMDTTAAALDLAAFGLHMGQ